jgi:hypothetical protein
LGASKRERYREFARTYPLAWILPVTGCALGLFGNLVPFAPGLLLLPLYQELEVCASSAELLALVCTMQFLSNGVIGLLSWCSRDARFFVCRALFLLVPVGWAGYLVGITRRVALKDVLLEVHEDAKDDGVRESLRQSDLELLHTYLRLGIGCFMCVMSVAVCIGVCIGGVNRFCCPSRTGGSTPGGKSACQWIVVLLCAFSTGYIFVANIGGGMALFTFFTLSLFLGVETKRAIPTALAIGGWTTLLPIMVNWVVFDGHTYVRLLLAVPGIWLGALLAPWFSKAGGPMCDLFFLFLALAAGGVTLVVLASVRLAQGDEDVNIDVAPVLTVPAIESFFPEASAAADGAPKHRGDLPVTNPVAVPADAALRFLVRRFLR